MWKLIKIDFICYFRSSEHWLQFCWYGWLPVFYSISR